VFPGPDQAPSPIDPPVDAEPTAVGRLDSKGRQRRLARSDPAAGPRRRLPLRWRRGPPAAISGYWRAVRPVVIEVEDRAICI